MRVCLYNLSQRPVHETEGSEQNKHWHLCVQRVQMVVVVVVLAAVVGWCVTVLAASLDNTIVCGA